MNKIGIVADDLTGATTVGVLLAKAGVSTAAYFDEQDATTDKDHHALILSTDSRALPKELAQKRVKNAVHALKENGATYFSKRIDTTLRGDIGAEVEAMLEELDPESIAVMVPAMPQSRRVLVGGYSLIDGVPLSSTPVADDVRTPVTESHIPTLMSKQTNLPIALIPLQVVLSGKNAIIEHLEMERSNGARLIIVDATTLVDVEQIAKAVQELNWKVLAVDPGPFSEKLAIEKGYSQEIEKHLDQDEHSDTSGVVFTVAGSASPVTKMQMQELANKEGVAQIPVSAEILVDRIHTADKEVQRAAKKTLNILKVDKPNVILLETSLTGKRINLKEKERSLGLKQGEAATNINYGLGEIVRSVLNHEGDQVRGIYMTGGDTMLNVLRALGAKGIKLLDYVIPQADLGRIIGGKFDGLTIVGKGGLTGTKDTAIDIVYRIFQESASQKPFSLTESN